MPGSRSLLELAVDCSTSVCSPINTASQQWPSRRRDDAVADAASTGCGRVSISISAPFMYEASWQHGG